MTDPVTICSIIVAAVALWVAWDSRRKTTQHVFQMIRVSTGFAESIEQPSGYCHFELYIKNLGLPFPRMSVALGFREPNGKGWLSYPLRAIDIVTKRSSDCASRVATGQVVEFGWRTHEMEEADIHFLQALRDLRGQQAVLTVYSAGYIVGSIRPGCIRERIQGALQNCVFRLCRLFKFGFHAANQDSWRARVRTPDSQTLSFALTHFLKNIRKQGSPNNRIERDSGKAGADVGPTGGVHP